MKEILKKRERQLSLRNSRQGKRIWQNRYNYLMMLPGLLVLFIFSYVPIYGLVLAFKDYSFRKGILGSDWADMNGLEHFVKLFKEKDFWNVTWNTVLISLGRIIIEFPVPIIFAVLMNEVRSKKFKKTVQSVMYFPYFISWVIIGSMVFSLFSYNRGAVNEVIYKLTGQRFNFLINDTFFITMLFVSSIWKSAGYSMILYMAAITNINEELYDAATIDGCNRFQKIRYVTLPGISVMIVTMLILACGGIMNAGFDQIFNLYNSSVYDVADILDTYIYRIGLRELNFSIGTAVGLFKSVINFVLLLVVNRICKKINGTGIYS